MRLGWWLVPLIGLELVVGIFGGWGPLLMALGAGGLVVSVGFLVLDLQDWLRSRAARRIAYRRWVDWWYEDAARGRTRWRP